MVSCEDSVTLNGGDMKITLPSLLIVGLLGCGVGLTCAADPMAEKEATPTVKERLTKESIKGTLMFIVGQNYYIKDDEGIERKIHVDMSTKLDKVMIGDVVKAYVTDKGHATTLQRVN
jgi:hypothetical protein